MHLAARLPGVDDTTGAGPRSRSRIGFSSFEEVARTAERGLFDFVLLAHESLAVLGALAAVTERLGLAAAVGTTFNEPYELARGLATLDHVSGGRVAWNVVPSSDAPAGENFRRGGFLDRADRYPRAAEFLETARELWDSWTADGVPRPFAHRGRHFDIAGEFTVPRSPQGHPVVIQAGDGDEGREFAASAADVVLTRQRPLEDGRAFYADVKRRLAAYGRAPDDLKIMLGVGVVLADTDAEARERAAGIRRGVDLPSRDDGLGAPLPGLDQVADPALAQGGPGAAARSRSPRSRPSGRPSSRRAGRRPSSAPRRRSPPSSTRSCGAGPLTASSSTPVSPRAGSTSSWTRWSRCSRNAAPSARGTRAPPCARTSDSPTPRGAADAKGAEWGADSAGGGFRRYGERVRKPPIPVPAAVRGGRRRP